MEEDDHFLDFFGWHRSPLSCATPSCLTPIYPQVVAPWQRAAHDDKRCADCSSWVALQTGYSALSANRKGSKQLLSTSAGLGTVVRNELIEHGAVLSSGRGQSEEPTNRLQVTAPREDQGPYRLARNRAVVVIPSQQCPGLAVSQDTAPSAAVRATRGTPILTRTLALPITGLFAGWFARWILPANPSVLSRAAMAGWVASSWGHALWNSRTNAQLQCRGCNLLLWRSRRSPRVLAGDFFSQTTGGNHMHDMQDLQMVVNW